MNKLIKYLRKIRFSILNKFYSKQGRLRGYKGGLAECAVSVSYPRSGSHWIRILLEKYFDKPVMSDFIEQKYPRWNKRVWRSGHDLALNEKYDVVLYTIRHPIPTMWSTLQYYDEAPVTKNIDFRLKQWMDNVSKWCIEENFTYKKYILIYEELANNTEQSLKDVIKWLSPDQEINLEKINEAISFTTKEKVKELTKHDQKVIKATQDYYKKREEFVDEWGKHILDQLPERIYKLVEKYNANVGIKNYIR